MSSHPSPRVIALIVAVNRSSHFPCRSLALINGNSVLALVAGRLRRADNLDGIYLCTSNDAEDDKLAQLGLSLSIPVVRGSRANVFSRLAKAAAVSDADTIAIVRGDAPLIDPYQLDYLLTRHREKKADFSYNEHLKGLPYGLGCDVVQRHVIDKMTRWYSGNDEVDNLHRPTALLRLRSSHFNTHRVSFSTPRSDYRFIAETRNDLEIIRDVDRKLGPSADAARLITYLDQHPRLTYLATQSFGRDEICSEKLMLFPESYAAIMKGQMPYPISVELSLTNQCNLNCVWCSDYCLRMNQPGELSIEIFESIVEELVGVGTKGLVIEGGGEPTLHPDFNRAVCYAAAKGIALGLITNGTNRLETDIISKFEWIRVSLDADCSETMAAFKGANVFDRVMANIQHLCRNKQSGVIGVGYVVTKHNLTHLEELVLLLSDMGVDYIQLRPVIDHDPLRYDGGLHYLKKYEHRHFSVIMGALSENIIRGNAGIPCTCHLLSTVIAANGDVYICGRLNIHEAWQPIGNLSRQSFREIWHGKEHLRQASLLLDGSQCMKLCPECRMTKYNQLIHGLKKIRTNNFI